MVHVHDSIYISTSRSRFVKHAYGIFHDHKEETHVTFRRDVPVGVPLDLSTPTGMSCIGTYGKIASQTMCQNIVFY